MLKTTDKRGLAGGRVIHAAQGGGEALHGIYFKKLTWCSVERRRPAMTLVETDEEPNCKSCARALAAWEKRREAMRLARLAQLQDPQLTPEEI
ncbi:MAG: hypothetical protein ACOWWM_09605 [Desulfobacterales bacterium]